jgi:RNA polymerase sigma-70 factor, ECF subfamily
LKGSLSLMVETSDKALVVKAQQGDIDAYKILVERHQRRIFYIGIKFHKNYEDAEDFTQEVFIKAYENVRTFSNNVPFSAWIYRIGYNHGINRISRKQPILLSEEAAVELPARSDTPEKALEKKEQRVKVGEIITKLPDIYHTVIKMRFFDELSYAEIAEIVGKPINTIKSHIFRAKEIIKQSFEKYLKR